MDVRLPNGRVIKNVPEGTPKDEIRRKAVASGLISDQEFEAKSAQQEAAPTSVASPAPTDPVAHVPDTGFRVFENKPEGGARASVPSTQSMEPYEEPTTAEYVQDQVMGAGRAVARKGKELLEESQRSYYGGFETPAAQTLVALVNKASDMLGFPVSDETKTEQQNTIARNLSLMTGEVVNGQNSKVTMNERGQVVYEKPETMAGTVAPYLFAVPTAFNWMIGSAALKGLPVAAKIAIASAVSDVSVNQLITDPYTDNLVDFIEDAFPDSDGLKLVTSYLSTDTEDPETVRRLKMAGQDTLLSAVFTAGAALLPILRNVGTAEAKKALEKGVDGLTAQERGELAFQIVEQAKKDGKPVVAIKLVNGKPLYKNGRPVFEQVKDADGNPVWRSYDRPAAAAPTSAGGAGNVPPPGGGTGATAAGGTTPPTPGSAAPVTPPTTPVLPDVELRQIETQAGTGLLAPFERIIRQTTTSRGFWTKTLFDMSQKSQAEKRALLSEGNHVAQRVSQAMETIVRESATGTTNLRADMDLLAEDVHVALTSGVASDMASLPEPLRVEVQAARDLIDGLARRWADSPAMFEEFKQTLLDNQGTYLRRAYEAFTNPNYKPDPIARSNAVDYVRETLANDPKYSTLPIEELDKLAEGKVVALLGRDGSGLNAYISDAVRVNTSAFSKRGDVPEEIRALLGEITNPSDAIIASVRKLVDFVHADTFSRDLLAVGDGKFLFESPQGIYTTPIKGTNTVLDVVTEGSETLMPGQATARGRYTTPQIAMAIAGKQTELYDAAGTGMITAALNSFAMWKSTSQAAKTIYSPTTHLKNLMGAAIMRAANGSNPIGSSITAWRTVADELGGSVDAAANETYERYLRLGIINTDVRIGEMTELMNTALDNPTGLGAWFVRKADEFNINAGKVVDPLVNAPRNFYMGTDDFFKIGEFEDYLATLKKAYPNESIDVLEARAAEVVRNVLPNYDLVPNAIKNLRKLPMGNFVGFPAEVLRTSLKISAIGFEELTSGNPVMFERGLRRLTAFGAFGGLGTELASGYAMDIAGFVSEEQQDALKTVSATPWSANPTVFPYRDAETGKLYVADTNSFDPYDYFRAPVKAMMESVSSGNADNKAIEEMIIQSGAAFASAMLKPYVSEAIVTEAFIEAITGFTSESGVSRAGTPFNSPGMDWVDSLDVVLETFWDTVEPGVITAATKLYDENKNMYQEYSGKETNPGLVAANLIGLTWRELDLEEHIGFKANDYQKTVDATVNLPITYQSTPEDIVDSYDKINRDRYRYQQDLSKQVEASLSLGLTVFQVRAMLKDRGLSEDDIWAVTTGQYNPLPISDETTTRIHEEVYAEGRAHNMTRQELNSELSRMRTKLQGNSLYRFEDVEANIPADPEAEAMLREGPIERVLRATGGMVKVPQAPALPATRKDKFTGVPYDVQAGGSYVEEDPLARLFGRTGFAGGGVVKATFDPEEAAPGRLPKAKGGVVSGKVLAACNKVMSKGAV